MPIYEYECESCGKIEEAWQKMSDAPLSTCNQCQGDLHKIVSQSSFHLKGTGWYVTDYSGKKQDDKTQSKESSKSEKTGSDSQPSKEKKTAAKTSSD
ncbi:FmdB family transcriptional regulator [Candidatus Magnetomorum sp. HK-1]|nr:FmdB family transcriptional regulator [Candidatus Magnetomorum sp. HK-1]